MPGTPVRQTSLDELCVEGEYAWAAADVMALREVADRLAARAPTRLQRPLRELSEACVTDPERALVMWAELAPRIPRGAPSTS